LGIPHSANSLLPFFLFSFQLTLLGYDIAYDIVNYVPAVTGRFVSAVPTSVGNAPVRPLANPPANSPHKPLKPQQRYSMPLALPPLGVRW